MLPTDASPAAPLEAGDEIAGVVFDGQQLYGQNCLLCHGPQGGGIYGVALAENPRLEDPYWPIRRVLLGGLGMPSFHRTLVPAEIAAVLSYVRTNFGNEYGAVDTQQVQDVREELRPELPGVLGPALADAPLGQQRYTQLCSACHGLEGGGDVGPPLAGNPALRDDQLVITRILFGGGIMPSFAHHPDVEIAAIASYIRTAWSNDYAGISAAQVAAYRQDNASEGAIDARTGTEDAQDAQ
jgi:mono/diheme cytochrome c family protein